MGCCGQKGVETDENPKQEENKELICPKEEELEVVELEKNNCDRAPENVQEEPKEEENKNEIAVEEEEKPEEEEIPEDINIEEDEIKEIQNNNSNSLLKSEQDLKGNSRKLKSSKKGKNKKNINNNKPFIITEIQSSPYKKIKVVINACAFYDEYMLPIWCPKDVYIKFRVEGKWRIDKLYDYTDSKGIPSNHSAGFNYGALIGRIGLGKKFVVVDEGTILAVKEGPLFLRQNLPKKMKVEPEGKLEVSIYDGIYMSINEINNRIGWIENGTVDNNNDNINNNKNNESNENNEIMSEKNINNNCNISQSLKSLNSNSTKKNMDFDEKELEKKLRAQFNNLRMNPYMFYEKFVTFNTNLMLTKQYLEKLKKEQVNSLHENENCYTFLEDYFKLPNQIRLKKNINKNNLSINLRKLDEDIGYFLLDKIGNSVISKCKMTQKDNAIEIVVQYLLDKKFRKYIFSEHSQYLIIKIFKNYFNNSSLVVVAIGLDNNYPDEEIEKL